LYGAPDTIRTCDRLVRSQVLYPAELRARRGRTIRINPFSVKGLDSPRPVCYNTPMNKDWTRFLPNRVVNRRIRAAAIKRVRKDLILHGKSETELSKQDLEYLVADAESDVKNQIKTAGLVGILALFGLSP
jgi:hypothetical protein